MTKLQSAVSMNDYYDGQPMSLEEEIQIDLRKNADSQATINDTRNDGDNRGNTFCNNDETTKESHSEPLGYHHFLYDVNIEYNPGGNRSRLTDNKHCFKMKYLPYMIGRNIHNSNINESISDNDIDNDCDPDSQTESDKQISSATQFQDSRYVDVTKTTCAFLGNSEYVPNNQTKHRHVVLEMISAKLSQPAHYMTPNSSFTNLLDLTEDPEQPTCSNDRLPTETSNGSSTVIQSQISSSAPPISSKRFVNYTILIKTAPGLDRHPAVIDRRFSDFLQLYQGLKSHEAYAKIIDEYVAFPKKVYMGNFSLIKIAERSVEFTRLLSLCMTRSCLLWSVPFISFLIDKELKDAHRLSLFGDPDDVQALIETAYFIVKKLYIDAPRRSGDSTSSLDSSNNSNHERYSPVLPNGRPLILQSPSNETISADSNLSNASRLANSSGSNNELRTSSPNYSVCDTSEDFSSLTPDRANLSSLNQRILVTYCTLFVVYCRGNQYTELKRTVQEFNQLISSQEFIESLVNTRHYNSLRACLLFLMNLTRGNVIDESTRLWLKRRLEDIDGAHAELDDSIGSSRTQRTTDSGVSTDNSGARKYPNGDDVNKGTNRVTKKDLTSLLRDRNFCSFNDNKFNR